MAKMFYTTDEAAQKLGVTGDQLKQMVTENKIREFRDGARVMFKVDQVDKLVESKGGSRAGSGSPIGLADTGIGLSGDTKHGGDVISLADSTTGSPSKEDTVVTGEGVQVLKPGEVKPGDTGAQTQIQSAVDDQLSLEGTGSGSGLLDLTRESDDTSLGAELLDEIYPGGDAKGESGIGSASGIFEQSAPSAADTSGPSGLENVTTASPAMVTEVVEVNDPASGAFGGMAFATVIISIVTAVIALTFVQGGPPGWVQTLTSTTTNVMIFGVILFVVAAVLAGFGFFVGKASR